MRKPQGDQRVGSGDKIGEHAGGPVALGFQRIDAQVERRARGQCRALLRPRVAKGAGEVRLEPFRIITDNMRRRSRKVGGVQPLALVIAQRLGRVLRAAGELGNRLAVEPAFALEHAEQNRARRIGAHDPGARCAPPQRVVDETGNRRAVAGAGKAMRQAPALERVGAGTALSLQIFEDLNGRRQTRRRRHGRPSKMRTMKMIHMTISTSAPTP